MALRCRPLLPEEKASNVKAVLGCAKQEVTVEGKFLPLKHARTFHFDRVFGEHSKQAEVYQGVVAPVVQRVLEVSSWGGS